MDEQKFESVKSFISDYQRVIDKLEDARVAGVGYNKAAEAFYMYEACDGYFSVRLTSEDCKELSDMFSGMSEHIKTL